MTQQYRVEWAIDIYADSPEAAAAEALKIQQEDNLATVFDCYDEAGTVHRVDLSEQEI